MEEKVTVLVPCYNAEKYIRQMIDSILDQTYPNFKLLIIDDGSTDRSKEIIRDYSCSDKRIILYENRENKGVSYVRNKGIQLCDSEYIALMDADDIAPPHRLETEINYLDTHPDIAGVGGLYQLIDQNGATLSTCLKPVLTDTAIRANMISFNPIANGSMMFRRRFVLEHHLQYCETVTSLEDYLFWSEFLKYGKINNLQQVMQYYRVSSTSIEQQEQKNNLEKRNLCFDQIHENVYQFTGLSLTESEKYVLKKATHDVSELDSLKDKIAFLKTLHHIQQQGKKRNSEFYRELRLVCREYAYKELKNIVKGLWK